MTYKSLTLASPIIDCPRNQPITAASRPTANGRMMNNPRGSYPRRSSPAKPADEGVTSSSGGRSAGTASTPRAASGQTIQRLQCFKTKKCRFWMEGRCNRGEACTYAHTEVELREPPDLTKTKLCTRWKKGVCDKNAHECAYAHGLDDLRDSMTPSTVTSRLSGKDLGFNDDDDVEDDADDDDNSDEDDDDRADFYSLDPVSGENTKVAVQDEENFGGTDKNTAATITDEEEGTYSDGLPSRLLLSPTADCNDEELSDLDNEIMLQNRKEENCDDDDDDDDNHNDGSGSSLSSLYPVHSGITTDVSLSLLGSVSAGSLDVGVVETGAVLATREDVYKKKELYRDLWMMDDDCAKVYWWSQGSGKYMTSIEEYFD